MNERTKKLATQSYDRAFEKCKSANHRVGTIDAVFTAFAMNEMHHLAVKNCIQTLVDHGYTDAATCLTQEVPHV